MIFARFNKQQMENFKKMCMPLLAKFSLFNTEGRLLDYVEFIHMGSIEELLAIAKQALENEVAESLTLNYVKYLTLAPDVIPSFSELSRLKKVFNTITFVKDIT